MRIVSPRLKCASTPLRFLLSHTFREVSSRDMSSRDMISCDMSSRDVRIVCPRPKLLNAETGLPAVQPVERSRALSKLQRAFLPTLSVYCCLPGIGKPRDRAPQQPAATVSTNLNPETFLYCIIIPLARFFFISWP